MGIRERGRMECGHTLKGTIEAIDIFQSLVRVWEKQKRKKG
jgi:hypothetical protein